MRAAYQADARGETVRMLLRCVAQLRTFDHDGPGTGRDDDARLGTDLEHGARERGWRRSGQRPRRPHEQTLAAPGRERTGVGCRHGADEVVDVSGGPIPRDPAV